MIPALRNIVPRRGHISEALLLVPSSVRNTSDFSYIDVGEVKPRFHSLDVVHETLFDEWQTSTIPYAENKVVFGEAAARTKFIEDNHSVYHQTFLVRYLLNFGEVKFLNESEEDKKALAALEAELLAIPTDAEIAEASSDSGISRAWDTLDALDKDIPYAILNGLNSICDPSDKVSISSLRGQLFVRKLRAIRVLNLAYREHLNRVSVETAKDIDNRLLANFHTGEIGKANGDAIFGRELLQLNNNAFEYPTSALERQFETHRETENETRLFAIEHRDRSEVHSRYVLPKKFADDYSEKYHKYFASALDRAGHLSNDQKMYMMEIFETVLSYDKEMKRGRWPSGKPYITGLEGEAEKAIANMEKIIAAAPDLSLTDPKGFEEMQRLRKEVRDKKRLLFQHSVQVANDIGKVLPENVQKIVNAGIHKGDGENVNSLSSENSSSDSNGSVAGVSGSGPVSRAPDSLDKNVFVDDEEDEEDLFFSFDHKAAEKESGQSLVQQSIDFEQKQILEKARLDAEDRARRAAEEALRDKESIPSFIFSDAEWKKLFAEQPVPAKSPKALAKELATLLAPQSEVDAWYRSQPRYSFYDPAISSVADMARAAVKGKATGSRYRGMTMHDALLSPRLVGRRVLPEIKVGTALETIEEVVLTKEQMKLAEEARSLATVEAVEASIERALGVHKRMDKRMRENHKRYFSPATYVQAKKALGQSPVEPITKPTTIPYVEPERLAQLPFWKKK